MKSRQKLQEKKLPLKLDFECYDSIVSKSFTDLKYIFDFIELNLSLQIDGYYWS